MKLFEKKKVKHFWTFSQAGNIWRFIFGGDKYIIGETRNTKDKKLYFFSLGYKTGKVFLKDFTFENDNFWVSIEGATENLFFIGRFEKPEIPYQKSIIALDIETGQKIWENKNYSYLFNTEKLLYGINRKFDSNDIVEIDLKTGEVLKQITENEQPQIYNLRNRNEDILFENSNYPVVYKKETSEKNVDNILEKYLEMENAQNIEYILSEHLLIFNYYIKLQNNLGGENNFINKFAIYDLAKSDLLFEEVLNKETRYCVPDNFFIKDNFLFYLKEKISLNCIKLNEI